MEVASVIQVIKRLFPGRQPIQTRRGGDAYEKSDGTRDRLGGYGNRPNKQKGEMNEIP
jgi:hypothetical protein